MWADARERFAKRAAGEILDHVSLAASLGCSPHDIRDAVAHGEKHGYLTVERQFFPARVVLTRAAVAWARRFSP